MLGLTTTRHLRQVTADLHAQLTDACATAETEQRRLSDAKARETAALRRRLHRALTALATTRRDLTTANGALRRVTENLLDRRCPR
ncbi:hypothetical protein ACIQI8_27150 [Streptomyces sp. NPDC092369]|uniref:hypothetical protein n=1 Tax=Streptomyces sp. NPDC092369 TaxID=3366015 RepID=UPI00381653DF